MQYLELKTALKDFVVFSLSDIRKIEQDFHRQRLNEWQNKGYIKKIIEEYYIFADEQIDDNTSFLIANRIYDPSYISLESALSHYSLIPETVYSITSVSSHKTSSFHSSLATFSYRSIKPMAFFGFQLVPVKNQFFRMAEPEKALLDFLYLNPHIDSPADFSELRLNGNIFLDVIDEAKLLSYLSLFNNKALARRLNGLLEFMKND